MAWRCLCGTELTEDTPTQIRVTPLKNKLGGVVVLSTGKHGAPARRPETPDHYRLQEMRKKKHKNKKKDAKQMEPGGKGAQHSAVSNGEI